MPSGGKRERAVSAEIQSALDASGFVGTWDNDLRTDLVYLSGSLIQMLGIAPEEAARGVPLSAFLAGIHPDDQERVSELVREAHGTVGRFAAHFRTVRADGVVHWVSARGQVEADVEGRGVRCLGMAVDITKARIDTVDAAQRIDVIERLVDSLIPLRNLLAQDGAGVLGMLVDMLLLELGKELSKPKYETRAKHLH
ncbi:PAS domain-containing protein [Methylobacterium sp. J-090]|uniref:PAS domain-containing protein n=1 Tax=Methylobacterium sp. J-090 TaxID=2836666 RepID=UPI001FB9799E|nr:PAS domain-containing protein [Methylobacterium sp. J-090]MCJ2081200.1 PAS domain-containing protein [Methylobacterium sp. J-090]